jgi:polysaccharide biosynthesis transport protein
MIEQTKNTLSKLAPSGQPMLRPSMTPATTLTPKEILGIIRRHVLLIILCSIGGLIVGGGLWAFLLKYYPKFTAVTYLSVLSPGKTDPTQLTSPIPTKDILYQTRLSKALLITQQSSFNELLQIDEVRNTKWFQSFDGSIVDMMGDLKDHFVANAQRDSDYVAVSMTCGNPKEAALIVNKMVDWFVTNQRTGASTDILAQLADLRAQKTNIEADLKNNQAQLDDLRAAAASQGITQLAINANESDRSTITVRLNDLTTQKTKLLADIQEIRANIGTLEQLAKGAITVQTAHQVETDPIMLNLGQQLSNIEAELARKLAKFGEDHKEVRQLRDQLKQVREERDTRQFQIAEQTRQANWKNAQDQLSFLTSRLEEVERNRAEAEAKQKDLDAQRAKYEAFTTLRDERQKRLDEINTQIEKVGMMRTDIDAAKVRKMGDAPEPLEISSPKWIIFFPGGFILGLFAGIGLAFLIELLNDLVRTPSDIIKYLRIPLMGMIPSSDEDDLVDGTDLCHVVRQSPHSIISESYRQIRTNLRLSGPPEATKTILVTSATSGEGKTSTAINLATTLVTEDKKVLLIDTNFRRPTSLKMFPPNSAAIYPGLSNLLTGQCGIRDAIRPTSVPNLDIIDCGPMPPSPAELFESVRMRQVLEELRKHYDNIILDSAPMLLVSDAKTLSVAVDGTLLVINADITRRGMAMRMLRELREINGTIIGCVLFNVKALKGGYFDETFKAYREYHYVQLAHSS